VTLTQLLAFARDAVLEKSTDLGLIPDDTSLKRYAHAAHQFVYEAAVKWNPRPWVERSNDVTYAHPLTFSTLAGQNGKPIRSIHLVRVSTGYGYAPVTPIDPGYLDFADIEDGSVVVQGPTDLTSRWFVEGDKVWLTPPPATSPILRVSFVRHVGEIGDSAELLGGLFADHHSCVAFRTAQMLYRKDESLRTPWDEEVADRMRALRAALQRNEGQRTRRVRRQSHFPNTRRR
jgi:hypothetical protein